MEWNYCWSVTPFLFESSGDSEEVKGDVHDHDHEEHEVVMDESEGVSSRFDDEGDDDDDDAQSCSYDHLSYSNTRYDDSQHDLSQRLIYDDDDGNINDDDDDDGDIDFDKENMKMIDSSKQQKRSHKFCVDSLDQREVDRKFWEACLAT